MAHEAPLEGVARDAQQLGRGNDVSRGEQRSVAEAFFCLRQIIVVELDPHAHEHSATAPPCAARQCDRTDR